MKRLLISFAALFLFSSLAAGGYYRNIESDISNRESTAAASNTWSLSCTSAGRKILTSSRARAWNAIENDAPPLFIENVGQFDDSVRFQVRDDTRTLWLTEDAIWITIVEERSPSEASKLFKGELDVSQRNHISRRGVHLKLSFPDANPHPHIEPFGRLKTTVSYFLGDDPEEWYAGVPVYAGIRYMNLYPGVDLEVTSENGHWSWRLVYETTSDPALQDVRLRVEGTEVVTRDDANLHLQTAVGTLALPLLVCPNAFLLRVTSLSGILETFQRSNVERIDMQTFEATTPFTAGARTVLVQTANAFDLLYSTFLGGSNSDGSIDIAVDSTSRTYVTGWTVSTDFPTTTGAFDTDYNGGYDAFVARLSADGTALEYAAFLGGEFGDQGWGIAVDSANRTYVTGWTVSTDFPTTLDALDTDHNGDYDAFMARLSADGAALEYATFLGGNGADWGIGITVDDADRAYATGRTDSTDFPTTSTAFDADHNGGTDAFVARLSADGAALEYATYMGGSGYDEGLGIAVDDADRAYATGRTDSTDFPTTPTAFDADHNGGTDAFVARLSADGAALEYATFLGGEYSDEGWGIAVDGVSHAYVTGYTGSGDFPATQSAFDTDYNGSRDAFVARLSTDGTALEYATFLGGGSYDEGLGIALSSAGRAYITGYTESADFPATSNGYDTDYNGSRDVFVARLSADGVALEYASFLGGSGEEVGARVVVDSAARAYVTGRTESVDFPTTSNGYDTDYNGSSDAFVAKLAMGKVDTTYTIAGRVSDLDDSPIAGITISASGAYGATTDAAGNYTITSLITGAYILTPAKAGYTFSPPTRTVNVPPNALGQDFVGESFKNYIPLTMR